MNQFNNTPSSQTFTLKLTRINYAVDHNTASEPHDKTQILLSVGHLTEAGDC